MVVIYSNNLAKFKFYRQWTTQVKLTFGPITTTFYIDTSHGGAHDFTSIIGLAFDRTQRTFRDSVFAHRCRAQNQAQTIVFGRSLFPVFVLLRTASLCSFRIIEPKRQ